MGDQRPASVTGPPTAGARANSLPNSCLYSPSTLPNRHPAAEHWSAEEHSHASCSKGTTVMWERRTPVPGCSVSRRRASPVRAKLDILGVLAAIAMITVSAAGAPQPTAAASPHTQTAEDPVGTWTMIGGDPTVNPAGEPTDFVGGDGNSTYFGEARFAGKEQHYSVAATSITSVNKDVDYGVVYVDVSTTVTFTAPAATLIPGDVVTLNASGTMTGTISNNANPFEAFSYRASGIALEGEDTFTVAINTTYGGTPSGSISPTFTVPPLSPEATFSISAGLWNCGACAVVWTYEATIGPTTTVSSSTAVTNTATSATSAEPSAASSSPTFSSGDESGSTEAPVAVIGVGVAALAAAAAAGVAIRRRAGRHGSGDADRPDTEQNSAEDEEDDDEDEDTSIILELTYPVGRSPMVLQYGWLFGARCIVGAGTPDERDVSDTVRWSGPATFSPPTGRLSRPAFKNPYRKWEWEHDMREGQSAAVSITLTVDSDGMTRSESFPVNIVSAIGYARMNDLSKIDADAHGCPSCPHTASGPIIKASGTPVVLNGLPVATVGDEGIHAACCGPNMYSIVTGDERVLINGKPAAWRHSRVKHCGGIGYMTSWHAGEIERSSFSPPR